ncbi:enolase C-terminal domain-like protein [Mycolicibacterium sp. CBM1]
MKALIAFDTAPVFVIRPRAGFDGFGCAGMLVEGPQGWGEFSPAPTCSAAEDQLWLTSAIEGGTVGWPDPVRGRVPVAVTVPAVSPQDARAVTVSSGCRAADVRVGGELSEDEARLEAVRDALGPAGAIRVVADGRWDAEAAAAAIPILDRAAGGLEFVVQPCGRADELATVRRRVDVRIALDVAAVATDRAAGSPSALSVSADVVVLSVGPLGGVRRALRIAELSGLPCVVFSAPQTSIGLAGGLALAGVLPELPFACGLGVAAALSADIVSAGRSLIPVDGYLPVAPMPPAPDPERLAQFSVDDPDRVAWWRRRLQTAAESI